ncbi:MULTISPECIES: glycosyltransferase [Cryobacterium]|uniref:glycosyltransferase n=1 Tax=Cryobacterium TaxID=69578 RepID=UPI000CD3AFFF|nr:MULTISPECIES: glycosyltransferase [Cryobacterium]POH68143.1 hypothetical protein C3B60_06125 [Cryobacterium zongtaii]TFC47795.1 hypothetical protein E3O57_02325 [Cryobacterium sp. TMN-39-2]
MTRIGWYVHHHGRGHLARLLAVAAHITNDIVCFSSLPEPAGLPTNCTWVVLDRDDTEEPETGGPLRARDVDAGGLLHWAPALHNGHRRRLSAIAAALERLPVTAFVVDVSAEVTLFVRLLGIPTILITQPGTRDDVPHALAFRAAHRIIAPWPGELLRPAHLADLPGVVYVGGISRFDGRQAEGQPEGGVNLPDARPKVLVLGGAGGTAVIAAAVEAAAVATPEYDWSSIGMLGSGGPGWSDDPWDQLRGAEIVVAWAGQNSIADLAAANVRAVVIPQPRPFDEQVQTAQALARSGLAVVEPSWPAAEDWTGVLARARSLHPDWSKWRSAGAGQRAAAEINATAKGARR